VLHDVVLREAFAGGARASLSLRRLLSILVNLGLHVVATTPKKVCNYPN
jgi:hypothetical protein